MALRRYMQVDVFADRPGAGNPLAVVLDAEGLDDAAMQAIARWTRLPETTFLFPAATPDSSYRLRIFSPRREVPVRRATRASAARTSRWPPAWPRRRTGCSCRTASPANCPCA